MFWGLIMEPQKRYSQVIKKAFHISMASLDISKSADGQPSQVMCGYEGRNYLLCTLEKPDKLQCQLDLYFEEGTTVSFATNGKSNVHLTGYLTKEFDELEDASDAEDQSFEVKAQKNSRGDDETEKPPKKKAKQVETVEEEEESDDSDFNMDQTVEEVSEEESGEESDEEDELEIEGLEEEEDNDSDETEEDEDDETDEEEVAKVAAVLNGLEKKQKKVKNTQETLKKDQKNKETVAPKSTPGPKAKKQENGNLNDSKKEKKSKEEKVKDQNAKKRTLAGGVIVEDLKEGQGDSAASGKFVHVYYEGRLKSNNKVFDKTLNGPGFGFRLGKGEVIKGWDIGVAGMKIGGKRRITCPPQVAYGAKGSPPVIPPNSTLVFEVELKKIK